MSHPVSVEEVAGELQLINDRATAYLHPPTGETTILIQQEIDRVQQAEREGDSADVEDENLREIREVMRSEDWLELPTERDIDDYHIMKQFCHSVEEDDEREQLLRAIDGRGAFRYFRDTVERLGRLEEWYAYRDRAYEEIVVDWLEARDIPYERED